MQRASDTNVMRTMHALEYRLASLVHWAPRQKAILSALDALARSGRARIRRVVDMGCGPGLLSAAVAALGLHYVGIDPERAFIDRCRAAGASESRIFYVGSVRELPVAVGRGDAFVLNGVAHHLNDADFIRALTIAASVDALIICDHRRNHDIGLLAQWLQSADRGKFVRPFEQFEHLPGFTCRHRQVFDIRLGPVALWPYFCLAYTPE